MLGGLGPRAGSPQVRGSSGGGAAAPWGAQPTRSTQLPVPTAPVCQPCVAQTKACSPAVPGRDLRGQSQPSPRDLAGACFSSGSGPQHKEACQAVRFSTASSVSRQACLKEESLFYLQQSLNHAPSCCPPRPFLALLFMQTSMPPLLLLSQQRRRCSSLGCAGGDRRWRQLAREHGRDMSPT